MGRRRGGATGLMSLVLGGFISGFGQKKNPQPASGAVEKVVDKVIHRLWISLWKSLACLWIVVVDKQQQGGSPSGEPPRLVVGLVGV